MFLHTIYERIQMNRIVNFKGNRAERHACASSNICRMPYAITVCAPAGAQKNRRTSFQGQKTLPLYDWSALDFFLLRTLRGLSITGAS